jgi:SpoIID/LytB domain protein
MRGAIVEGTAARARLDEVPLFVFGKTGTSIERRGYRPQGWFVGLAAEAAAGEGPNRTRASALDGAARAPLPAGVAAPENVGLAVLVLLRRGRGAEAAAISKPIFDEYAGALVPRDRGREVRTEGFGSDAAAGGRRGDSLVRVGVTRARVTLSLDLEDYVFGVLAAEGSVETEPEALKALAVAARTYATKNAGRHAGRGFDLCDSTHCQRYAAVTDESARPEFYELARTAVRETEGEVLRDAAGRVAESYFSASCGGATADIRSLWGERRPAAHLRGSRDEACGHHADSWTDLISSEDLLRALRSDGRSDVGARLDAVRVARRDASGRAELIALEGERPRLLRGWDFKIIVGRALGWNVLKSSRFEVRRAGASYVFRGTGFGHGLGLCQAGARTLASRGATYRQILGRYLPGASLGRLHGDEGQAAGGEQAAKQASAEDGEQSATGEGRTAGSFRNVLPGPAPDGGAGQAGTGNFAFTRQTRQTLAGQHFRLSYPARMQRDEAEALLRALEAARADLSRRLTRASLDPSALGRIEVVLYETTGDFVGATGQAPWVAAVTRGRRVELQPVTVLRRRGVLTTTVRHELVHVACEALARGRRAPLWLVEGLAAHVAGEGPLLARHAPKAKLSPADIERGLAGAASAEETRALYAAAHAEVAALVRREGEAAVWRRAVRGS